VLCVGWCFCLSPPSVGLFLSLINQAFPPPLFFWDYLSVGLFFVRYKPSLSPSPVLLGLSICLSVCFLSLINQAFPPPLFFWDYLSVCLFFVRYKPSPSPSPILLGLSLLCFVCDFLGGRVEEVVGWVSESDRTPSHTARLRSRQVAGVGAGPQSHG
jgi:hypothetical protein